MVAEVVADVMGTCSRPKRCDIANGIARLDNWG